VRVSDTHSHMHSQTYLYTAAAVPAGWLAGQDDASAQRA
jgi:hypothetical protein